MHSVIPLLSSFQHTLQNPTSWVEGTTLRNIPARVRFRPLPPDTGRAVTVQVKEQTLFTIPIGLENGRVGHNWTDAIDPATGNGVGVIEHPAAAVVLAGLDNVEMVVDYPTRRAASFWYGNGRCSSVPLMGGNAAPYLAAIAKAGLHRQSTSRRWLKVKDVHRFNAKDSYLILSPREEAGWSLTASNPHYTAPWRKTQVAQATVNLTDPDAPSVLHHIANARPTNSGYKDWFIFNLLTLGTGRKANFAAIHGPFRKGPIHGQPKYEDTESIHHRILDLLGDLLFFGGFWQADITVYNGRHRNTDNFRKQLLDTPVLS